MRQAAPGGLVAPSAPDSEASNEPYFGARGDGIDAALGAQRDDGVGAVLDAGLCDGVADGDVRDAADAGGIRGAALGRRGGRKGEPQSLSFFCLQFSLSTQKV